MNNQKPDAIRVLSDDEIDAVSGGIGFVGAAIGAAYSATTQLISTGSINVAQLAVDTAAGFVGGGTYNALKLVKGVGNVFAGYQAAKNASIVGAMGYGAIWG